VVDLAGDPVGGALHGHGVQAEALGRHAPGGRALEEIEDVDALGEALDRGRPEQLDSLADAHRLASLRA
jgi:hypothetical protein